MRPIKLTMTAFGPFAKTEVIEFNKLGDNPLFLIKCLLEQTMNETFYKGAHGNLSVHCVATAIRTLKAGDSRLVLEHLPIGTEIVGIRHITDSLGASTAIKVELADATGTKTELLTVATASADAGSTPLKPIYIGDNGPSDLVLTNTGTGSATGEVMIQLEYRFKGY